MLPNRAPAALLAVVPGLVGQTPGQGNIGLKAVYSADFQGVLRAKEGHIFTSNDLIFGKNNSRDASLGLCKEQRKEKGYVRHLWWIRLINIAAIEVDQDKPVLHHTVEKFLTLFKEDEKTLGLARHDFKPFSLCGGGGATHLSQIRLNRTFVCRKLRRSVLKTSTIYVNISLAQVVEASLTYSHEVKL